MNLTHCSDDLQRTFFIEFIIIETDYNFVF